MEDFEKRFKKAVDELNDIGVFYGENYSGKYHEKYPHSSFSFALLLDKHRGAFEAVITLDGCCEEVISFADISISNPSLMILDILEKAAVKLGPLKEEADF